MERFLAWEGRRDVHAALTFEITEQLVAIAERSTDLIYRTPIRGGGPRLLELL